jgi:hypothetical protein
MCFRCNDMVGEMAISKRSKVFTRQAHVLMPGKVS